MCAVGLLSHICSSRLNASAWNVRDPGHVGVGNVKGVELVLCQDAAARVAEAVQDTGSLLRNLN